MNKIKIVIACLLVVLTTLVFLRIKNNEESQQKADLSKKMHKALEFMMFDLYKARENTFIDAPADGQWHDHLAFDRNRQGALEYVIKDGHLLRTNRGKTLLIADHISDLRIRRQKDAPDILEVQIEAKKNVELMFNLKIRIQQ